MTLIEMLIATAVSLILMAAVAQVFAAFSGAMSNGRSILETDSRLRNVARRLRDDLNGATTQMLPPRTPDQGEGYFEIIEGPNSDDEIHEYYDVISSTYGPVPTLPPPQPPPPFSVLSAVAGPSNASGASDDRLLGDTDDVLLFTTRDTESPFVGRLPSGEVESSAAEVAWFARPTPNTSNPVMYTLYRKQLLVMGYVAAPPFSNKYTDGYDNDGDGLIDGTNERPDQDGIDNDGDGKLDEGDGSEFNLVYSNSARMNQYSNWLNYYVAPCDISVRRERGNGTGAGAFDVLVPNTLGDLTRRENRFLHNSSGDTTGGSFPYPFVSHLSTAAPDGLVF